MSMVSSYLIRYNIQGSSDVKEVKVNGNDYMVDLDSLSPGSKYEAMIFSINMDYVMSQTAARISFTTGKHI